MSELLAGKTPVSQALQTVMLELDFNYDKARNLFKSMLAKRDQWLRHLVHQDMGSMQQSLQYAWSNLVDEALISARELMSNAFLEELVLVATKAADRVDFSDERAVSSMQTLCGLDLENIEKQIDLLSAEHWRALAEFVLVKQKDKVRSRLDKHIGFPAKTDGKAECVKLFDSIRDDTALIACLAELGSLPEAVFSQADWHHLQALETVLKALAVHLQLRFRATGECDHGEISQRANLALSELQNPTDLGLLLDGQIQHILVDEFQDTSHTQLELLKKLTQGWHADDTASKTLFLVGDPMQSIYRFREADVGLFLQVARNKQTNVFENVEIDSLVLTHNFRSSHNLVGWFNTTFSSSFPKTNDVLTGAIKYAEASSNKNSSVASSVGVSVCETREQEALLLLQTVRKSLESLPDENAQIAILVRSRPQLDYLLPVLDQHGINYAAVDIRPLHEQQTIKDVVALAQAIAQDDAKLAWLALLRGPWCGLTLSEISQINKAAASSESIWGVLKQDLTSFNFTKETKARLQRFVGVLGLSKKQYQRADFGSLVRWAWLRLGGPQTLSGCQIEDVNQVFELLNKLQRGGSSPNESELQKSLERLKAVQVQTRPPKVVVSTIHKAKGLQYHTVILPGLSNRPKSDDRDILMWAEHQARDGNTHLLLAPFMFDAKTNPRSHYEYLRRLDGARARNEVMRLLYVGCTRAEQRLELVATVSEKDGGEIAAPNKASLLAPIWNNVRNDAVFRLQASSDTELVEQVSDPMAELPINQFFDQATDQKIDQTLCRLPYDFHPEFGSDFVWKTQSQLNKSDAQQDQTEITFEWATEVATAVGVVLHNFLQFAESSVLTLDIDADLKQRWRAELLGLRLSHDRVEYALSRLVSAVENIQVDSSVHFIFENYVEQHNEYAISTLEDGAVKTVRLDRTFVDRNDVRWIIDYKSTTTRADDIDTFVDQQIAERHFEQLDKYAQIVRKIDTRPIRLAVYFPLLNTLRSWEYVTTLTEK